MGCCFSCLSEEDIQYDKSRKCTDKFWLFLFILSWIVLIGAAGYSFMKGDPTRIIYGYDSFGNICGQKNRYIKGVPWSGMDMRGKPYLFHMNPENISYTLKICVTQCFTGFKNAPDKNLTNDYDLKLFYQESNSKLYRYDYDVTERNLEKYYQNISPQVILGNRATDEEKGFGPAPKFDVTKQRPVLNRCVATNKVKLGTNSGYINALYNYFKNMDALQKIFSDIYISRHNIGKLVALGVVVSLVVVFSIHYLASIVSTIIMVVATLIMIALTGFSWYVYIDLKNKTNNSVEFIKHLDDHIANSDTFLALSLLLTFITIIVMVATYFMQSRVNLMVALFHETASCFRAMPGLVIQPLWTTAVLILFFLFWSTILLAISTADDEIVYNSTTTRFQLSLPAREALWDNQNGQRTFREWSSTANKYAIESVKHKKPPAIRYIWVFLIVMLFWSSEFILGCQQMTVAGSVASWYFCRDKSTLRCPITSSIHKILTYHLGSVAKGSLLLTLFKIPRLILMYLEAQFQKIKGKYRCLECTLACCHCFWYLLERFIRYINHNAYTIIAIEGTPYCTSAQVAFSTLAANTARVVVINSIGDFILFLGKLIVTASVALVGMYFVRFETNVYYMAVPVIFASIVVYFIAHSMLSVYEMVIDTLFLCYVEDVTKNANSPEGYYAPPSLLAFAGEENINSGAIRIARDVNPEMGSGRYQSPPMQGGKKNGSPPVGFIYPQHVLESSH